MVFSEESTCMYYIQNIMDFKEYGTNLSVHIICIVWAKKLNTSHSDLKCQMLLLYKEDIDLL